MKRILYLITALIWAATAKGQLDCRFTHYSSENGLSQNTIMSILQDRKGNLWFSTWDGVNKFDGYTFKVYKARPGNHITLTNNRADHLYEDKAGFIYLQTYDSQVFRFDPRTETFLQVPAQQEGEEQPAFTSVRPLSNGAVWLLTKQKGACRLSTDPQTGNVTAKWYANKSDQSSAAHVYGVMEDSDGREWLLTDNGLGLLPPDSDKLTFHFAETSQNGNGKEQPFFSGWECGTEVFFGSGNGRVWRYQKSGGQFQLLRLQSEARVVAIQTLHGSEVLLATDTDGFYVYDMQRGTTEHYSASLLPASPVVSIYVDRFKEVWFEQHVSGTVAHFNPQTRQVKVERMKVEASGAGGSHPAFHAHEDVNGYLWIHPYGGGFGYFDRATNQLRPFYNHFGAGEWRFSNRIHSAFSDRQGNLWLCTHSKGLEKATFHRSQFHLMTPAQYSYESLSNEVRALYEDSKGNIWVGLKDGKIRIYDRDWHEQGYLTEQGTVARTGTPLQGATYGLLEDRDGCLWICTKGAGIVKAEPRGNSYRLTRYQYEADNIYSLSDDNVYSAHQDSQGRIWVATFGGGINYLTRDREGREIFVNHRNHLKGYPIDHCHKARFVTDDGKGNLWVGTTQGALMIKEDFQSPEDAVFHHYQLSPDNPHSLGNNDVHWIHPAKDGSLYLATFGGGLSKLVSLDAEGQAEFQSYSVSEGLPSDVLLSIREDAAGNLWMSTENGVCKYTPATDIFENYASSTLSERMRFSEAASAYTSWGTMLFGGNEGVLSFCPDSIHKSSYVPPIVLSQLLVNNKAVVPGEHSVLQHSLDDVDELELSHKENFVTFRYAALDYSTPSTTQYAYMLEGFDEGWNYVGPLRSATYTNLPKGDYVFKVRSTNADGVWTDNIRSLAVTVLPSFWETPFAYFLYVLIVLLVIVTAVYILFMIYRLKHKVSMEKQMTDMKLRFFTDISHELRTPLTLIAGPVEYVLQSNDLPSSARTQLQVVERNTQRMLHLVNQILDFRKIQNHKMKMRVQLINVVQFATKVMANFDALAKEHHIDFLFETESEEMFLYVDADKFEKILFNLLSNAFKYTPDGKMITVFLREDEKAVVMAVEDQGIGIAENRKKSIFDRFENLVDRNIFNQSSTGIGLSLVKELVELHKADISVESKLGVGSRFSVRFQKGKDHYDENVEFLQDDAAAKLEAATPIAVDYVQTATVATTDDVQPDDASSDENSKEIMMVVEDNTELRAFLRSIFETDYCIVEAENGEVGWKKALKFLPDIVITDLMMPRMDGIALTRALRSGMTTSHIPIVLLTAKSSIESRLEGLEYGADDYVTKPFSATYLKARVRNLLTQRRQLQTLYRERLMHASESAIQQPETESAPPKASDAADNKTSTEMAPQDRKFMDDLIALMEKNMDNGELMVDDLVHEMAVSRSVFFKKLKTLTGLAPIEFIKEMRINRAVELIATGEYTMTQIAYMVGINDPRYFSKCFKQKMGMTPTEFRERALKR